MSHTTNILYAVGGVTTVAGLVSLVLFGVLAAISRFGEIDRFEPITTILLAGSLLFFIGPLISFVAFVFQERDAHRARRWKLTGCCPHCGYDLRGARDSLSQLCPECGRAA